MEVTFTHAAAVVALLAIIASQFLLSRKGLLPSLAASVALGVLAAVIIRAIA